MLLVFFQFPFVFLTFPDATSNTTSRRECPGVLDFVCQFFFNISAAEPVQRRRPRFQLLLCHFLIVQSVKGSNSVRSRQAELSEAGRYGKKAGHA